jgi:HEAT repeat protein
MDSKLSAAAAALEILDDEVESDTDLLDLVDNFEVIASAFDAWLIPPKRWRRNKAKPLQAVLRTIGNTKKNRQFQKLADRVTSKTKEIRRAAYRGFDFNTTDLISDANQLREDLQELLAKLFAHPGTSDEAD